MDASISHFKSEKQKEMIATPEYVPTCCRYVGIKLQAVSEVTESSGFKTLNDKLAEEIKATRREWATRFYFPAYDMNVKALKKRFHLSFCRLMTLAARGFIAQVGIGEYDATVAVMDLLSMHGAEVLAPLNVTTHDFLVLLKEATGMTIIPSPTVEHSLSDELHKINGTSSSDDRGQVDGSSTTTMNAPREATAAATNIVVNEQLTAAESAVAQAASHLELMRELAGQALAVADEAARARTTAHETLALARRAHAAAIDSIDIATTDESLCVAELDAADKDKVATIKRQLALGAKTLLESADHTHAGSVRTLNALCMRMTSANTATDAESDRADRMTMTPTTPMISIYATSPTATTMTPMVTPRSLPCPYRNAASMLHRVTTEAIRDIVVTAAGNDSPKNVPEVPRPPNDGRETVINALKTLLDDGIVKPLQMFHALAVNNEQDRRIIKATSEPLLEQAATRIAAVVEAERPVNHPTLKGIIHVDVEKMTNDLHRRIKSLEAQCEEAKSSLKRKASTSRDTATLHKKKAKNVEGDGKKSKKTPGNAVARSTEIPNNNKKWKSYKTTRDADKKRIETAKSTTGNSNKNWKGKSAASTPAIDNATTATYKKTWRGNTGHKSGGRKGQKPTVARN